jgi:hypothetical protein
MSYDYAIEIASTPLDSILSGMTGRFIKYTSATRIGGNLVLPYRHGTLYVPDKYFTETDVLLEVNLPDTTNATAAQGLSELALLLSSPDLVAVQQTDPYKGDIEALVEAVTDPVPTQDRFTYLYGFQLPSGFWQDVSPSSSGSGNPPSITTLGDRPIQDMVITFSGPGYVEHTDPLGQVSRVEVLGGAGAGTYVLDVGAGTITKGGTPQDEFFSHTQPWVMKWEPDSALSLASSVSWSAVWRNKWA